MYKRLWDEKVSEKRGGLPNYRYNALYAIKLLQEDGTGSEYSRKELKRLVRERFGLPEGGLTPKHQRPRADVNTGFAIARLVNVGLLEKDNLRKVFKLSKSGQSIDLADKKQQQYVIDLIVQKEKEFAQQFREKKKGQTARSSRPTRSASQTELSSQTTYLDEGLTNILRAFQSQQLNLEETKGAIKYQLLQNPRRPNAPIHPSQSPNLH